MLVYEVTSSEALLSHCVEKMFSTDLGIGLYIMQRALYGVGHPTAHDAAELIEVLFIISFIIFSSASQPIKL